MNHRTNNNNSVSSTVSVEGYSTNSIVSDNIVSDKDAAVSNDADGASSSWQTTRMKCGICAIGALICFSFIAEAVLIPTVIESVLAKSHIVNAQNAELVSKAARIQSIMDGVQCFLYLIVAPAVGKISDVYGRKVLIFAVCISGFCYTGLLLMGYYFFWLWCLILSRVLGCLFMVGFFIGSCMTYISDITPNGKKAANFGYAMASIGVGIAVAPTACGWLVAKTSVLVGLISWCAMLFIPLLLSLFLLQESLNYDYENDRYHEATIAREFPGLGTLLNPFRSISVLFATSFVFWLSSAYFLYYMADSAVLATTAMYTSYRYNWDHKEVGYVFSLNGGIMIVCQTVILTIVTRFLGERKAVLMGTFTGICVNVIFALANKGWMFFAAQLPCSYAVTVNPSIQALVSYNVPGEMQGLAISSLMTIGVLGQFFGNVIAENVFSYFISDRAPIHFPGAHFLLAAFEYGLSFIICAIVFLKYSRVRPPATPVVDDVVADAVVDEATPLIL